MERPYHFHHSRQIGFAHGRPRRRAQPIPEERLGPTPFPQREVPREGETLPASRLQIFWSQSGALGNTG